MRAAATGWLGAYGAGAALLSLLIMWPFVAGAAEARCTNHPQERMGLKRASGWFLLANLASLLMAAPEGYLGLAFDSLVPWLNDPIFQLTRQQWAIPLDLCPFFVLSMVVEVAVLWAVNGRTSRAHHVSGQRLALLDLGKNLVAYTVMGLTMWVSLVPSLGGYQEILGPEQASERLAQADARIWYIPPGGGEVRSADLDGSSDRLEWAGPIPRPYEAFWVVPASRQLLFATNGRVTAADLATGKTTVLPVEPPAPGRIAPPPGPSDLAALLLLAPEQICPQEFFPPVRLASRTRAVAADLNAQADAAGRKTWLAQFGPHRALPDVPTRPDWLARQEIQAFVADPTNVASGAGIGSKWLVASYGRHLLVLDPQEGWIAQSDISAEAFVVVPDAAWSAKPGSSSAAEMAP